MPELEINMLEIEGSFKASKCSELEILIKETTDKILSKKKCKFSKNSCSTKGKYKCKICTRGFKTPAALGGH